MNDVFQQNRRILEVSLMMLSWFAINLAGCSPLFFDGAEYTETIQDSQESETISMVAIRTINGNIDINTWEKAEIAIEATKKVRGRTEAKAQDNAQKVEIEISEENGVLNIITHQPRRIKTSVNYSLSMPADLHLQLKTTNGNVTVLGNHGDKELETTNGNVKVDASHGSIDAKTTNGNIDAEMFSASDDSNFATTNGSIKVQLSGGEPMPLSAKTTNGSVRVWIPYNFGMALDAETTNGSVHCDLNVTVVLAQKRNRLHGKINEGGPAMNLKTTNGSIHISAGSIHISEQ